MFVLNHISHLIANDFCPVNFSINICVGMPINPGVNATLCYEFAQIGGKCTIQY